MDPFIVILGIFLVVATLFLMTWSLIDWLEMRDINLFDNKDDWD